jgi:glucokinase
LTLGTGVGGGLILGGKMFNGGLGHGVELGHMCLQFGGPLCTCGNLGCVETLCNAPWLIRQSSQATDAKMVIDAAKEGDVAAKNIFDRYVDQLSSAIVSCTNLLDPEVVALGGGVSLAGEFLFAPLREQVLRKSFFHHPYKIVPATLGNDAGIIGAAMLAINEAEAARI